MRKTAVFLLLALLTACGAGKTPPPGDRNRARAYILETQERFRDIARTATPAVGYVYSLEAEIPHPAFKLLINSELSLSKAAFEWFRSRLFTIYNVKKTGSGFLINDRGYMLTSYHVVKNSDRIMVTLGWREIPAVLLGADPLSDIAMIKIRPHYSNRSLKLGDSDHLEVGQWALAVGNPFNLTRTFTVGIISALKRSGIGLIELEDFIQTDATIHSGNSGGPLLNLKGEVIGINSASARLGGGLGLAIPINIARNILPLLISGERVERGMLGVSLRELTPELAAKMGVEPESGALVTGVYPGSPANGSGIRKGDVINRFNGKRVASPSDVKKAVLSLRAGVKVRLDVIRFAEKLTFSLTLASFEPLS